MRPPFPDPIKIYGWIIVIGGILLAGLLQRVFS